VILGAVATLSFGKSEISKLPAKDLSLAADYKDGFQFIGFNDDPQHPFREHACVQLVPKSIFGTYGSDVIAVETNRDSSATFLHVRQFPFDLHQTSLS